MWLLGNVPVRKHIEFKKEARPFTTRIYIPMMIVEKVIRNVSKPIKIKKPAFGQYVFLKVRDNLWSKINDLKDFKGWVLFAGSPETVLPKHIRSIKALEKLNFGIDLPITTDLVVGQVMMVNIELMQGRTGKVVDLLRNHKCVIDVDGHRITLDIDKLSAIR
jgi:transcription antitermination factor NusG